MLTAGWPRAGLSFAAGAVAVLGQAPFHLFIACFISFPVLVWLIDGAVARPSPSRIAMVRPAFFTGWLFGFGYFTAGLWWIGNALFVEAEEFLWMWPMAVLGLPAVLAVFYGAAAALARALWSDGLGRIAALAFAFGLAEWSRSFILTGFPWNAIGYAAMPVPVLMQPAAVIGVFGMNALAVYVFALPAMFAARGRKMVLSAVLLTVLISAQFGFGFWRIAQESESSDTTLRVRVVQPAVDQSGKWDPEKSNEIFEGLLALTSETGESDAPPDIVVWPETSVPFILTQRPDAVAALAQTLQDGQILLAGAVRLSETETRGGRPAYFNSLLAVSADGVIFDAGDKKHLVPFGEYLPFGEWLSGFGIKAVAAADRGYSATPRRRTLTLPNGAVALPLICYEAIFPHELSADGDAPSMIVNVTNDAWYGDTPGPYQHAHQARIRAVENGLPLVRAANNGVSALYDPLGRQRDALGYGAKGAFDAALPAPVAETVYRRHRELPFMGLLAGLFALALAGRFGRTARSRRGAG